MNSASGTSGIPQLMGLVALALFGLGLVADHQRGFRVDGVGVGQPGVHNPLDELLVGAGHLGRQRDPHALHQRSARDEAGPGSRYGHGSRDASIFSGRSSSCVTWPLGHRRRSTDRNGNQTLRSRARTSAGLRIWASTSASSSASCGFIWLIPQCAASVSSRMLSTPSSSRRASSTVHMTLSTGSSRPGQLGLGGQERVVEGRRCGRRGCGRAAPRHSSPATSAKQGCACKHLGGQAVHVGGAGIDAGVEQGGDAVFDVAVVADRQGRDADDAGLPWPEAGRLDVDDRPARAGFGSRPAPGVAHKFQDGTATRHLRYALDRASVSGT